MVHFIKSTKVIVIISVLLLFHYGFLLLDFGDHTQPYGMLTNAGEYLDKFLLGVKTFRFIPW